MATQTELLDLTGIGQRTEGARFELRDRFGSYLGAVTPNRVVEIENAADGVLKRSISNFVLAPSVAADVNPLTDRVWAYWRVAGVDYQLGVFLFASWSATRRSYGLSASTRLLDQGVILGQRLSTSIGFTPPTLIRDAIAKVFDAAGIHDYVIDPANTKMIDNPVAWPAGSANTYASVASYLCQLGGLADWFFDNHGVPRVIDMPDTAGTAPLVYAAGRNIIAGSIVEQNDLLDAPNRYLAIDTANRDAPAYGSYDLPATAPNSIAARGFPITKVVEAPGVGGFDQAAAYAQTFAQTDPKSYETVTFSGPPDPRHDTHDVVSYLGVNYQETSWHLTCAPGGPHQHFVKRVYL